MELNIVNHNKLAKNAINVELKKNANITPINIHVNLGTQITQIDNKHE